jgi:hypothetical protein
MIIHPYEVSIKEAKEKVALKGQLMPPSSGAMV